jgi:NDP-sugar pyrophosphorylase family protein
VNQRAAFDMDPFFKDLLGQSSSILKDLFESQLYPWQMLEKLKEFMNCLDLGQIYGFIDPRADVRDLSTLYLGEGSEIGPGALIEGSVYLGRNVKVRHGAYIRGPVFIDDESVIGHASEIKHSIFFKQTSAAHFNYVGNSVLGCDVQLGAGATCANLRFDKKPVIIRTQTERLITEHKKMGAIIGQGARVGCQAVLSPGCVVNKNALILPLTNVQGFYR